MRQIALLFVLCAGAGAQTPFLFLNNPINLLPPSVSDDGSLTLYATATAPYGAPLAATNLYALTRGLPPSSARRLTIYTGSITAAGVTGVSAARAGFAAFTAAPKGPGEAEEVHLIDLDSGSDRTLATDKEGCIQPMCPACYLPCVGPVHLAADAGKVLYAVSRQQPFHVVNADGSGLKQLPVYSGSLAPSPQRVIGGGLFVFTSSAPSGPTFAAAATDVYAMNLDGSGLRQVTRFGDAAFMAFDATISADGSLIAFECNVAGANATGPVQIWVVRPDGTGLRQLSSGPGAALGPSISADGSIVAYVQNGQVKRVRTGDGATLELTRLSLSEAHDPAIVGDGSQVAFALGPPGGAPSAAVARIPTNSTTGIRDFQTVYAPRVVNTGGVVSATGYGPPTPGSLITVFGVNLGNDELSQATQFPLPGALGGLTLTVNGQPVPLLAVTRWQINAQLPQTTPPGAALLVVLFSDGASSPPADAQVRSYAPESFFIPMREGKAIYSQAAAVHAGTGVLADMTHPAEPGETIEIYGLGLGLTNPAVAPGVPSPAFPLARALEIPRLQIGGLDAVVGFAGLAPGFAGVYQVNAVVPSGLVQGLNTLTWIWPDGKSETSVIAVK